MKAQEFKLKSTNLGQDFDYKIYGTSGKPLVVFPCSQGRYFDYENFGMIEILKPFIEAGDLLVITVDSRDSDSWYGKKDSQMGVNHRKYELCITQELIPHISKTYGINECFMTTGNSWGAYHALNFSLKFPGIFDSAICLSGAYSLKTVVGNYYDESIYYNDIPMYLANLWAPELLRELKDSYFIICHGKGSWELHNDEAAMAVRMLYDRKITYWYDVWGENYPHDWNSWKQQIGKFIGSLKEGVIFPNIKGGIIHLVGKDRRIKPLGLSKIDYKPPM